LIQEVVSGVAWFVSILSWGRSFLSGVLFWVFNSFIKSFVANWWEVISSWALIHDDGIILWLCIPWDAPCKSVLILIFISNKRRSLCCLLGTIVIKLSWLLILIINIEVILVLIIVLDVNILCNILDLVNFKMVVLVIVIVCNLRIIHYSGRYLWLRIILVKVIEDFWFFNVMESRFFFAILFSSFQGFLSFWDLLIHYRYGFLDFCIQFLGSQFRSVFFLVVVNNKNFLFKFNMLFNGSNSKFLVGNSIIVYRLYLKNVWIAWLNIWWSLLLLGTENLVKMFELLLLVLNFLENSS